MLQEMDTRPCNRTVEEDIYNICAAGVFELVPSPAIIEPTGWYGNAVLTRLPVISSGTLDISQRDRQPRNVQTVIVETNSGPLTIVNTHKGLKKGERRCQVALLCNYIQQRLKLFTMPIVLAGDFNEWQLFTNAFFSLNAILEQHKVGATFPSRFPLFSLDRVWTTPDLRVTNCYRIRNAESRLFSDHLPILLDVALL